MKDHVLANAGVGVLNGDGSNVGDDEEEETPTDPIIPPNEISTIYSDWSGTVFGDVGGQDKITKDNFEITESEEDANTVVLRSSGNRGKISSSSDGIAYYFKQVPTDANFEITATATVETFRCK